MTGMKLYESVEALAIIDELIEEHADAIRNAGGDIMAVPAIAELLDLAEGTFTEKVERVALKVRELGGAAEIVKAELERLQARKRSYENAAAGLKGYLLRMLQAAGKTKVEGKLATVAIQQNPPALNVPEGTTGEQLVELHEAGFPYITHVPASFGIDKRGLLDAVKATEAAGKDASALLPTGWTVTRGDSLRIR